MSSVKGTQHSLPIPYNCTPYALLSQLRAKG